MTMGKSANDLRKFIELLQENTVAKAHNKKVLKEAKEKNDFVRDYHLKDVHVFSLSYKTNYHTLVLNSHPRELIYLDEEDVQYFTNKYGPKVEAELNDKIEKLKDSYKPVITK